MQRTAYQTEYGTGWVVLNEEELVEIVLPGAAPPQAEDSAPGAAAHLVECLEQYYSGNAMWIYRPDFAEAAANTPFQREIYKVVAGIRPGETMSYGEVAEAAGRPGAARAVGTAMARNPYPPIIPCHRVVAADGGLGGYGGGVEMKASMLEREQEAKPLRA